jgi:hypothetical protein
MSRATIIDGKAIAEALRREVAAGVAALKRETVSRRGRRSGSHRVRRRSWPSMER